MRLVQKRWKVFRTYPNIEKSWSAQNNIRKVLGDETQKPIKKLFFEKMKVYQKEIDQNWNNFFVPKLSS